MFISVTRCNIKGRDFGYIGVFDTSDCSTESVLLADVRKNGIRIANHCFDGELLRVIEGCTDFVTCKDGVVHVGNREVRLERTPNGNLLNRRRVHCRKALSINYMFMFGNDIVLRCSYEAYVGWHTFSLHPDGSFEEWDSNYKYCTDKSYAVRLDMVSEV